METLHPFIHTIDPVITDIGGVYLWWYGLSYTFGFLGLYLWCRRKAAQLGLTQYQATSLSLHLMIGVLFGGRFVEVVFYEWEFYSAHLSYIPALWLGGMSTHGLLFGGILGMMIFCLHSNKSFLKIADSLVIPGAWIMGVGRIGNFIDGQISGAITTAWSGVVFPDLPGARHPVVLYDGLKNLLIIPVLLWLTNRKPNRGMVFACFLFLYAGLRLYVDIYREYRVESLGIGTGQIINIAMALLGMLLILQFSKRKRNASDAPTVNTNPVKQATTPLQIFLMMLILIFSLVMPSDWTQDVPARYGHRHSGMEYSSLYPHIPERMP